MFKYILTKSNINISVYFGVFIFFSRRRDVENEVFKDFENVFVDQSK